MTMVSPRTGLCRPPADAAPTRACRRRSVGAVLGVLPVALAAVVVSLGGCRQNQAVVESESVLAFFAQPTPMDAARWAADQYNADNRYRGTLLLANAPFGGEDVYLRLYESHLTDADPGVRAVAARALGNHGGPEHVALILPLLEERDAAVRLEAVRALQRLHNADAVAPLLVLLRGSADRAKDDDPDVRAEAAVALGQYAQRPVLSGLISGLSDESFIVTRASAKSLRTLTGQNLGDDPRRWIPWVEGLGSQDPFAGREPYVYPVFQRDKTLVEWLPFIPDPPNEVASAPAGMPDQPAPAAPAQTP